MEENLYDTNILIDLVRKGVKNIEGSTTVFNIIEFPRAATITGLKVLYPIRKDYDKALKISVKLLEKGKPVPTVDIVISSICLNRNLTLITKDEHFLTIKPVEENLKVTLKK